MKIVYFVMATIHSFKLISLHLFKTFKIPTCDELKERLAMFMSMYNEAVRGAHMDLVFFKDAMVHLMKVWTRKVLIVLDS